MDIVEFGKRIKIERKRQHITLERLSEQIGISRNFLWEIEAGRKTPALPTLLKLCEGLNLSADYLLGLRDDFKYLNPPGYGEDELARKLKAGLSQISESQLRIIESLLQALIIEDQKKQQPDD